MKRILPLVVFPLAAMAAGLLTICVPMTRLLSDTNPLGSLFFGVAMALCLWLFFGLRSIRKTIIFLFGSFVAAVAGMLSAIYVTGNVFYPGPWGRLTAPIAFTGGFVGGFVLTAAALSCFSNRTLRVFIQSTGWALAGGALAVLGSGSDDWFEHICSQIKSMHLGLGSPGTLLSARPGQELALMIIWQTGMGLVIALAVRLQQKRTAARQSRLESVSRRD